MKEVRGDGRVAGGGEALDDAIDLGLPPEDLVNDDDAPAGPRGQTRERGRVGGAARGRNGELDAGSHEARLYRVPRARIRPFTG